MRSYDLHVPKGWNMTGPISVTWNKRSVEASSTPGLAITAGRLDAPAVHYPWRRLKLLLDAQANRGRDGRDVIRAHIPEGGAQALDDLRRKDLKKSRP